jgi:hypothetical protein
MRSDVQHDGLATRRGRLGRRGTLLGQLAEAPPGGGSACRPNEGDRVDEITQRLLLLGGLVRCCR